MHQDNVTHRELVAAVANLKTAIRAACLASLPNTRNQAGSVPNRLQAALQRASDAASNLRRLLAAVSDQTLRLPLETSKRLVEVDLPELLSQLLGTAAPNSAWQSPETTAPAATAAATSDEQPAADAPATVPAIQHPNWQELQVLVCDVFNVLTLLCGVAVRACTRSSDPLMVLMQLASPKVMQASVKYMQQLWQAHTATADLASGQSAETCCSSSSSSIKPSHVFAAIVAAFSGCCSVLAAAVDAQQGLEELELQLVSSLCSTDFLPTAVQLLLSADCADAQQRHSLEADCQQAGWQCLTLALFLSGGDIAVSPAGPSSVEVRPGQHIPSSVLAAHMRQQADAAAAGSATTPAAVPGGATTAAAANMAATEAATGLPLASMQAQLLGGPVLLFLEERLFHAVREMRVSSSDGSSSSSSSGASTCVTSGCSSGIGASLSIMRSSCEAGVEAAACSGPLLLPGRCVPDGQDVLAAALRTLRCWRALLVGPAGSKLPLSSPRGVQLLLAVLNGALAESVKECCGERQALRGRLVRVAVHCLQLLCGCVGADVLAGQLSRMTASLSGVVGAAGAYWDAHKRAIKSADLPYTGQVRCVDKVTGDMLVRYTMAAQSALLVLMQLAAACGADGAALSAVSGEQVVGVMLSAGVIPSIEALFRQVPVASPAHVAAADLLVAILPLGGDADLSAGQLPLMATLRKFMTKAVGIPPPDREAAIAIAVKLADMLGRLAASCEARATSQGAVLLQHAAAQLLPALQVFCAAVLRGPVPSPCSLAPSGAIITVPELSAGSADKPCSPSVHLYAVLLGTYKALADVGRSRPELGLMELLLGSQALTTAAGIIASNYWSSPQVAAAACQPCNSGLTGQHAAQLVASLLEDLLGPVTAALPSAVGATVPLLHASCSDDCLVAVKCNSSLCGGCSAQCRLDGACSCCSPKACSDVTPTGTASGTAADGKTSRGSSHSQAAAVSPLMLLSALLQSKLLPEAHRLLQQLPQAGASTAPVTAAESAPAASQSSETPRQSGAGAFGSAAVPVPSRLGSGQLHSSSAKVGGHSPTFSILAPQGGSSLRSQSSGHQQFFSAYTGSEPPTYSSSAGHTGAIRIGGSRFAAGAKRLSDGTAAGTSPPTTEGDVGGLLRGGSWECFQTAWNVAGSSAPGDAYLGRQASSGFGSSPSLASLTAASSEACGLHDSSFDSRDTAPTADGGSGSAGADAPLLQLRLQAVLVAVGQAVLELAESGALGEAAGGGFGGMRSSGSLSNTSSQEGGAGGVAGAASAGQLRSRSSFAGSVSNLHSMPGLDNLDVFAGLRSCLAAARPAGVVTLGEAPASPGRAAAPAAPGAPVDGSSHEMLFPVDLGLTSLHIATGSTSPSAASAGVGGAASNAAGAGTAAVGGFERAVSGQLLPTEPCQVREVLRSLTSGVQAAAPVLARSCSALDLEQCGQLLLARLSPRPVGCWNAACVNMAGASEAATPAKPCSNCKVAVFCSKGCEKTAWSSHTMACCKLAAAAVQRG